jgi:membrane fusion protein, heavy metal efflux system
MKRQLIAAASFCLSALAVAGPGAHGPNGEHLDDKAPQAASGLARLPDGSVNVPKLAQRRMAIRTQMVADGEHARIAVLNGRIAIDPNFGGRAQAPFAGRIEPGPNGLPVAGMSVRKGQVLLHVRPLSGASDRAALEAGLAEARANRTVLERKVKRLESLEGVVPAREIEAARAELAANRGREQALGRSAQGVEAITAPADGVVASANVLNGQVVEARDVLFDIVAPGHLLVEAQTSDPLLAGAIVGATLAETAGAELTLLGGARSLRDGMLPVNFRAKGKSLPLAVGQPVTVLARLRTTVKGIALPAQALARNPANETIVWIKSGAQRFIALPVEAQAIDAQTVIVTRGLSAENRVVVAGAHLINQIR